MAIKGSGSRTYTSLNDFVDKLTRSACLPTSKRGYEGPIVVTVGILKRPSSTSEQQYSVVASASVAMRGRGTVADTINYEETPPYRKHERTDEGSPEDDLPDFLSQLRDLLSVARPPIQSTIGHRRLEIAPYTLQFTGNRDLPVQASTR